MKILALAAAFATLLTLAACSQTTPPGGVLPTGTGQTPSGGLVPGQIER